MLFNRKQFEDLAKVLKFDKPCVSIYIPTFRAGQNQEDRLRFKNAISEAVDQLTTGNMFVDKTMDKEAAHEFMSEASALLDKEDFWSHLSDGLAAFVTEDKFEYHIVPIHFNQKVYVAGNFYLRPMMPLLNGEDRFFLLALSQNEVRFFEGHKHHITPVKIKDLVPENLEAALMLQHDEVLQSHSGNPNDGSAIYHGQGGGEDRKDKDLRDYLKQVDDGLMKMLHDENAPLIIACVDYLVPIYKEVSNYSNIVDANISGNPENDDPVKLHEKAWSHMDSYFQKDRKEKKDQFTAFMSENKASFSINDIIPAAIGGRVETLFVDKDAPVRWGFYQESDHSIQNHKEQKAYSTCLLNMAAVQTYLNGGTVYTSPRTDFPNPTAELNAIYRY